MTIYKVTTQPPSSPAIAYKKVTASDTVDFPDGVSRAIILDQDIVCTLIDPSNNTCTGIPLVKGWNPGGAKRIFATDLSVPTANIWAVY